MQTAGASPAGSPGSRGRAAGVPVLGIDVGSTNVKTVLVLLDADAGTVTELGVRAAPTPHDADRLLRVVHDLVRSVLDGRPVPQAVGVASMAETGVPLGADGRALTGLLRWDGRRGGDDADRLAADLGRDALFAATGVRASAKVPLVTWAWLRRTEPALWRRMVRWAGAADLVCHALTGRLVTDHTLAGRTMAYRLPPAGAALPEAFDPELLATVGLTADRLPEVARPEAAAGVVVHPESVRAGLPAGTPVVVAGHDHAVGVWAAGVRAAGDRADSIGTAEAVVTVLGAPVDRAGVAAEGMSLVRTAAGTHEALLAGSPAAGAMVAWWLRTVLPGRTVDDAVAGVPLDAPTGLLVLPYLHGRQGPHPDPAARVQVVDASGADVTERALRPVPGTGVPADAARCTVAMLEGLVLHARWLLDEQQRIAGDHPSGDHPSCELQPGDLQPGDLQPGDLQPGDVPPGDVPLGGTRPLRLLAGAAATSPVWMGLKAAATPGPVHRVAGAEPVATGAALLAAERVGLVPAGRLHLPDRVVTAPPGPAGRYEPVLRRFVAAARG